MIRCSDWPNPLLWRRTLIGSADDGEFFGLALEPLSDAREIVY